jgi:HSP20 family protein
MFDLLRYPGDLFAEFDRLHREMDLLFNNPGTPAGIRTTSRGTFPAVNIGTTPEAVEIYAFVPGIDPAKLEISIDRGVLTLSGERQSDLPQDDKHTVYSRERFTGQFKRVMTLPEDVDQSKVEARCHNGILHITAARQAAAKPRRIEIK